MGGREAKKRLPVRSLLPWCLGLEVASGSNFCGWGFPTHALALAASPHSILPLPQPPAGPQPPLQDDHQNEILHSSRDKVESWGGRRKLRCRGIPPCPYTSHGATRSGGGVISWLERKRGPGTH